MGEYRSIVERDPSRALMTAQNKAVREYSRDVLGSLSYAPWLKVFASYRGEFLEGWIPHNYFVSVLLPKWLHYSNLDAKIISRRILCLEQVPDVAYFLNGFWLDRDYENIPRSALKDHLFKDSDYVFVKLDRSWGGQGVWKLSRREFDAEDLSARGDLVVQLPIRQHAFFDQFTADSVATIRILTVKEPERPARKVAAYLRLGRYGDAIVSARRNIRVPIVDDDGALGDIGSDTTWAFLSAHPDSGATFGGKRIPGFRQAAELCRRLHDRTPITVLIGWDVTIDAAGEVVLMEFNQGRVATHFPEASLGPLFAGLGWENAWKST